ncbi:cystatin-like protein [Ictalurus furcatus]|uniref:cystatin-like protein n=1 Tax=Ictalurus furcatus TaxID=66913 RepID=UPI00234FCAC8|nr:cystatin-like protein [Ictalurus furcatus]
MDGALKVFLLMSLLVSAQTFDNYRSLPHVVQQHIHKAVKEANKDFGAGHHIAYHSLKKPLRTLQNNLYVNVILKVTTCRRKDSDAYEHRDDCPQKQNTAWIDCLVCKTSGEELVDCGTQRAVSQKKRDIIRSKCTHTLLGSHTAFLKTEADQQVGCLGCI